jgi:hypothetical protein
MEARNYQKQPTQQGVELGHSSKHRITSGIEDEDTLIVIAGNYTENGEYDSFILDKMTCYCVSERRWYHLEPLPYALGGGAEMCTYDKNKLFVSGGSGCRNKTAMYDGYRDIWTIGADLNDGRYNHVMCAVGDSLYVIGGREVTGIERCNIEVGEYVKVAELEEELMNTSAAVTGEKILLFGGLSNDCETSEVFSFDTVTHTMTVVCYLPSPEQFTHTHSLVCDDTILTISTEGLILKVVESQDGETRCEEIASIDEEYYVPYHNTCVLAEKNRKMTILGERNACGCWEFDGLMVVKVDTGEVVERMPIPFPVIEPIGFVRLAIAKEWIKCAV